MPTPRVYVETTIPSLYHDRRVDPPIAAMRDDTRCWWAQAFGRDELVTGPPVFLELRQGPAERRREWTDLIVTLTKLEVTPRVIEIADAYVAHRLMPISPAYDALHLALASCYHCDALATWDTRHLANARKITHLKTLNARFGLTVPEVVTPRFLLWRSR